MTTTSSKTTTPTTTSTTTSTTSTTTTTITTTTTSVKFCRPNSEEFTIDQRKVCLEFVGRNNISEAASLCSSKQGKLPLPKNQKENDDYVHAFITVLAKMGDPTHAWIRYGVSKIALDLNDIDSEGNFVSSTGKPVEWFNWGARGPNNSNLNEDHVEMVIFDDNFTESDLFKEFASDVFIQQIASVDFESLSGKWNDKTGSWQVDVFCEYDQ